VSTFRLEPEHFHLTTGTFNLIVKDRIASRLSGALSVRTNPRHRRESVRPRNLSKLSRRRKRCQPAEATGFPPVFHKQRGGSIHCLENTYDTRRNALPLPKPSQVRHRPKRKTMNSSKIAWRFCFSRNPSGTLSPNADPKIWAKWRLAELDATGRRTLFRQALTRSHCPRLWSLYQNERSCARGNRKRHLKIKEGGDCRGLIEGV
jgi:hypothetical protein